jgi:hypothetical protein
MKNTVRIGNLTQLRVQLRLLELGYNIFVPFGDGGKVDMIIEKEGVLSKCQVKTSRKASTGKSEVFNAYSTSRTRSKVDAGKKVRYTKTQIDYFMTIDSNNNLYMIPIEVMTELTPSLGKYQNCIVEIPG